jgi:hypothetical protein
LEGKCCEIHGRRLSDSRRLGYDTGLEYGGVEGLGGEEAQGKLNWLMGIAGLLGDCSASLPRPHKMRAILPELKRQGLLTDPGTMLVTFRV